MLKPRLIIFASGAKDGGGSGFENLATSKDLDAEIVAVVSNHEHGGVREKADTLGLPFIYFPGPYDAKGYSSVLQKTAIDSGELWVALSGWFKQVHGLDPKKTFNIHPALLSQLDPSTSLRASRFGGKGMYGSRIHEAVKEALDAGEIHESGFSMHFVTDELDRGPVFFEYRVPLEKGMSVGEIGRKVQKAEHEWQPKITNMVVHGEIHWDGKDPTSLKVPPSYQHLPRPKLWC